MKNARPIDSKVDLEKANAFSKLKNIPLDLVVMSDVGSGKRGALPPDVRDKFVFRVFEGKKPRELRSEFGKHFECDRSISNWRSWALQVIEQRQETDKSGEWHKAYGSDL